MAAVMALYLICPGPEQAEAKAKTITTVTTQVSKTDLYKADQTFSGLIDSSWASGDVSYSKVSGSKCLTIGRSTGIIKDKKHSCRCASHTMTVWVTGPVQGKKSKVTRTVKVRIKELTPDRTLIRVCLPVSSNTDVNEFAAEYNRSYDRYRIRLCKVTDASKVDPADYDALIIPGGNHVYPSYYGEEVCSKCKKNGCSYDKKLDKMEMKLVKKFCSADKPVLGICRGAQLLNVYFGGTLNQNIGGDHYHGARRSTSIDEDSHMYQVLGKDSIKTLHWHHASVKDLGKGLTVTSRDSEDGTIESYVHDSLPVMAYQFHPEKMFMRGGYTKENGRLLMNDFFDLCSEHMQDGEGQQAD